MRILESRRRAVTAGVCAAALGFTLAACSDSDDGSTSVAPTATEAAGATGARYDTPLQDVCPDTVIVQTNWWPEPDHGGIYQLLGSNPTIDKDKNTVTGPLGATGVQLEIRAGGPALGFQQASSLMAQDDDILLGLVGTDEAIENSGKQPNVAVFSTYERNPQVFIWGDPTLDFKSVRDIGESGLTVQVFDGASYLDVFKREGLLKEDQLDTSYRGTPERFVAEEGKIVIQGFVTNEPYHLENDVEQWKKPVKFLLVDEYPVYQSALSIRKDKLEANKPCLEKIVPLFQEAHRDYVADPTATNKFLVEYVGQLETSGFTLSDGLVAEASKKQKELGLIANGKDGVLGSFEDARVQTMIDKLLPVFKDKGSEPKEDLKPADLVTNEFLDTGISLN